MSDPIPRQTCACGWPRPLIAVTRAKDGRPPSEAIAILYDCPECGRAHRCGELSTATAEASDRARLLVRRGSAS